MAASLPCCARVMPPTSRLLSATHFYVFDIERCASIPQQFQAVRVPFVCTIYHSGVPLQTTVIWLASAAQPTSLSFSSGSSTSESASFTQSGFPVSEANIRSVWPCGSDQQP